MNYQKLLATLMICGYFTVYAETSTNKSIGGEDKADTEALVDKLVIPTESTKEGVKNSTELSKKENKKVSSEAKAELDPETKTLQKMAWFNDSYYRVTLLYLNTALKLIVTY